MENMSNTRVSTGNDYQTLDNMSTKHLGEDHMFVHQICLQQP